MGTHLGMHRRRMEAHEPRDRDSEHHRRRHRARRLDDRPDRHRLRHRLVAVRPHTAHLHPTEVVHHHDHHTEDNDTMPHEPANLPAVPFDFSRADHDRRDDHDRSTGDHVPGYIELCRVHDRRTRSDDLRLAYADQRARADELRRAGDAEQLARVNIDRATANHRNAARELDAAVDRYDAASDRLAELLHPDD